MRCCGCEFRNECEERQSDLVAFLTCGTREEKLKKSETENANTTEKGGADNGQARALRP